MNTASGQHIDITTARVERNDLAKREPNDDDVITLRPTFDRGRETASLMLQALDMSTDAVLLHEPSGRTRYANNAARSMIAVDDTAEGWPYRPAVTMALVNHIIPNIAVGRPWSGDIDIRDAFGYQRCLQVVVSCASLGESPMIMVTAHDVTARRNVDRANAERAFVDELTRLPNRAALKRRLDGALNSPTDDGELLHVAALFIDLDRFKAINDTLGHHVGDELLTSVAARLATLLTSSEMLARLGGDEFVVVIDGTDAKTVLNRANAVARSALDILSEPFVLGEHTVYVSASIGIALNDEQTDGSTTDLLRHADLAMFRAKNIGRSRIVQFTSELVTHATRALSIETALHRAVKNNEFEAVYQPIWNLNVGEPPQLRGFEALARWRDGRGVVHEPASFLNIAEQSDLISHIDTLMMSRACRDLVRWTNAHPELSVVTVSVNVSARQLSRSDFGDVVSAALNQSGLAAHRLVLEVTETNLMVDLDSTLVALEALRDIGVRVAIDDFGTGYCSLSYLRLFKANTIKIDRQFIKQMLDNDEDIQIVSAIAQLATTFGMDTIAEGVERVDQMVRLQESGCSAAQGFLFDVPVGPDEVTRRLSTAEGIWASSVS